MSTLSLSQYLCREQQLHDLDPVLSRLIVSVSEACKTISFKVRNGALAGVLGMAGSENVQGEDQKKLDIISNDIFVEAVALSGSVCGMVSEEIPEVIPVPEDLPIGPYLICFDPLDGSSNIDINVCYHVPVAYGTDREASAGKGVDRIVCGSWQGASGWRTLFLFCLIFPCSAVLFSLPTDCKRRRSPRTPRTQTTLFRSKISNALMTQSSLLARREFFRTSPHYKSAPIRSFCDFEQRASPKNHQKVELHKTSLQSCRVLL